MIISSYESYKNYNLSSRHVRMVRQKYAHSFELTLQEIKQREHCPYRIKRRSRDAYNITKQFLEAELTILGETQFMVQEDILSQKLRDLPYPKIKKKKKKKKKKNYCTCEPDSKMCFCRKPNGDWCRPIPVNHCKCSPFCKMCFCRLPNGKWVNPI